MTSFCYIKVMLTLTWDDFCLGSLVTRSRVDIFRCAGSTLNILGTISGHNLPLLIGKVLMYLPKGNIQKAQLVNAHLLLMSQMGMMAQPSCCQGSLSIII